MPVAGVQHRWIYKQSDYTSTNHKDGENRVKHRRSYLNIKIKSQQWFSYLYLLHSEVQEGVLVADADQALGALASHAGAQASIQLHHHQFVQAVGHVVRQAASSDLIVGLDLWEKSGGSVEQQVSL